MLRRDSSRAEEFGYPADIRTWRLWSDGDLLISEDESFIYFDFMEVNECIDGPQQLQESACLSSLLVELSKPLRITTPPLKYT